MSDLDLRKLHLAVRYRKNIDVLVDEIREVYDFLRGTAPVDDLQHFCGELFSEIEKKSADISPHLDGSKDLGELTEATSFTRLLSGICPNERILRLMDFISFKIIDFAFVFGNERAKTYGERQFSEWSFRSFQLLFKQKGQLWILNCLRNILEYEKKHSGVLTENDLKRIIRETIDRDFSPYPQGLRDRDVDQRILEIRELAMVREGSCERFESPVRKEERKMGFEVEHQIPCPNAERLDAELDGELGLLMRAGDIYHQPRYPILKDVHVGVKVKPDDVIRYGSLTRDPSNARYPGYIACEYSSPVGDVSRLKSNAEQLCRLFKDSGGGLVREDCGTHVHVSIEDLKDNPLDSEPIRKQKLEALKRILRNFILLRKDFESVLPEYRRGDNSLYSGQAYTTFVDGDEGFILGLINACESYEELRSVLMVGGKYLSLAPFSNTFEFRSFPATTNHDVLSCWFQLLNEFVDNSIKGVPTEDCLNKKLLARLQELTHNGERVFGMHAEDSENICFRRCNSFDFNMFEVVNSPVVKTSVERSVAIEAQLYREIAKYAQQVNRCIHRLSYARVPDLRECSVAMSVDREPGEVLKSMLVRVPNCTPLYVPTQGDISALEDEVQNKVRRHISYRVRTPESRPVAL